MKVFILILVSFLSLASYAKVNFSIEFRDAETDSRIIDEILIADIENSGLKTISNGIFEAINFKRKDKLIISSESYIKDTLTAKKVRKNDTLVFYLYPTETFMLKRWEIEKATLKQTIKHDTIYLNNLTDFSLLLSKKLKVSKVASRDSEYLEQRIFISYVITPKGEIKSFEIPRADYKSLERSCLRSLLSLPVLILEDYKETENIRFTLPVKIRMG